jgi:hypothetical protein
MITTLHEALVDEEAQIFVVTGEHFGRLLIGILLIMIGTCANPVKDIGTLASFEA